MSSYDPNHIHVTHHFVVGVKTILIDQENRILVLKRSDKTKGVSKWSLPGGHLEKNENPNNAVIREVEEETQLKITSAEVFAINFHPSNEKPTIIIGYKGTIPPGQEVILNWEHTEYKFLDRDEALKLDLTEDGRYFIEQYNK